MTTVRHTPARLTIGERTAWMLDLITFGLAAVMIAPFQEPYAPDTGRIQLLFASTYILARLALTWNRSADDTANANSLPNTALLLTATLTLAMFLDRATHSETPFEPLVLAAGLRLLLHIAAAYAFSRSDRHLLRRRVGVFGGAPETRDTIVAQLAKQPSVVLTGRYDERRTSTSSLATRSLEDLIADARNGTLDDVIVYMPNFDERRLGELMTKLDGSDVSLHLYLSVAPTHERFELPLVTLLGTPRDSFRHELKGALDRSISLFLVMLLSPVLAALAIAIRVGSPGPVLFRQPRYGLGNRLFQLYKFRTMHSEKTDIGASKLVTRGDPRVTPLGRLLRKSSLDELPQLFNVLKGEMSLVGPRPHAVKASAEGLLYQDVVTNYAARHRVKPGITGLAQVHGWRGETDTKEKIVKRVEYDLNYIGNWSLGLDFKILAKTLIAVWITDNAY